MYQIVLTIIVSYCPSFDQLLLAFNKKFNAKCLARWYYCRCQTILTYTSLLCLDKALITLSWSFYMQSMVELRTAAIRFFFVFLNIS